MVDNIFNAVLKHINNISDEQLIKELAESGLCDYCIDKSCEDCKVKQVKTKE